MSNYASLKNIVDQVITTNGMQAITGAVLNDTLKTIISSLGAGFQFGGIVTPASNPGSPDQNYFYFATTYGRYTNMGGVTLPNGISIIKWNGAWSSQVLFDADGYRGNTVFASNGYEMGDDETPTPYPLALIDNAGYVLAILSQYGLQTKFYNSQQNARVFPDATDNDLAIVDENGYAIEVFKNGTFLTKYSDKTNGIQWRGKKWYAYGTSITNIASEGKYPNFLRDISGMLLTNKGISGGGIGNGLGGYSQGQVKNALMNTTDGKLEADLITLETGANDVGPNTPLGTVNDTGNDTLAGCLNQCLRYLQANTTAQIVVFPSPAYNSEEFDAHYYEWQLLMRDICFINKVYFIDGENGMGWAKLHSSQRTSYIVDTIHQTDLGGFIYAESVWRILKNIPLFHTSLT